MNLTGIGESGGVKIGVMDRVCVCVARSWFVCFL